MDHAGASFMAIAVLAGLLHRHRTGEGQWIDISCTDAGALLNGPALLDYTVNGRPLRRPGSPDSNADGFPAMAPRGIYPAAGDDEWIALSCRDDGEWNALAAVAAEAWATDARFATVAGRMAARGELERLMAQWTSGHDRFALAAALRRAGVPATAVQRPSERIERDPGTGAWGLWPTVTHSVMGPVRVDGLPLHFSESDWVIERAAPCLGEHNDAVFGGLLGHTDDELARWRDEGVL
jgi:crotonobetainyl-CoA:carnitine CoA-transferase CaiB-like acyl-CoA transferase